MARPRYERCYISFTLVPLAHMATEHVHMQFPTESPWDLRQASSLLRVTWAVRSGVRRRLE